MVNKKAEPNLISLPHQRIFKITVFQSICDDHPLKTVNAKHCYLELTLQNNQKYVTQFSAGSMSFQLNPPKNPITTLVQTQSNTRQFLSSFRDRCNELVNRQYNLFKNNCYNYVIRLLQLLECPQIYVLTVKNAFNQNIKTVKENIQNKNILLQGTIKAAQQFANYPLRYVDKIDDLAQVVDQGLSFVNKFSSNVSYVVDKSDEVVVYVVKKINGVNNASKLVNSIPIFSAMLTIFGQTVVQVIKMSKDDFKGKAIVKGLGNIAVGTIGNVAMSMSGAELGMAIGFIGGPFGVAIIGAVGGFIGGIAGQRLCKAIMPWNW